MNYQQQMDRAYALTEEYLASCFQGEGLEKAMRYSLCLLYTSRCV